MLFNEKQAWKPHVKYKYNFSPVIMLFSPKKPLTSVFNSTEDTFISSN